MWPAPAFSMRSAARGTAGGSERTTSPSRHALSANTGSKQSAQVAMQRLVVELMEHDMSADAKAADLVAPELLVHHERTDHRRDPGPGDRGCRSCPAVVHGKATPG